LQAFGDNNCSVVASKSFEVNIKPDLPEISVNQQEFCIKETILLSTPDLPGATYSWSGPNGFTSGERIVSIPVPDNSVTGVYSLIITVGRCSSDPSEVTIPPVSQTPVISLDINENNPCTPQFSYTINYPASNYEEITSDFGQGAVVNSGSGNGPYTVSYSIPGTRQITITAIGSTGCEVTVTKLLEVPVIPPTPVIIQNKDSFCVNDTILLSTPGRPNTSYVWSGPNNFISSGTSVSIPVTGEHVAGQYTLTATEGRCSSEAAVTTITKIITLPIAAFASDPVIPAKIVAPASVQFTNNSKDADTYFWDFGDGTTSTEENPVHVYSSFGKFDVTLTAIQSRACSTSVMKGQLIISADNKIFIPNTFTPNADQVNDEFVVSITNIGSYRIQIFNRYGSPIFQASDIFENWKGVYNNTPLPVGTYFYIIDAVSLSGEFIKKSGTISIIK
jgi:gliding motility-associated-like protein